MTGRLPATLLAVVGALLAVVAAHVGGSPLASPAWAIAAGIGLTLMLRGVGLRVVGVVLVALAITGAGWAIASAQWVALAGFALCVLAASAFVVWGPGWRARRPPRADAPVDLWKAMDEGGDPTDEQGSPSPRDNG